jgi:hypothetical protein
MNVIPPIHDWVTERSKCGLKAAFDSLCEVVKSDIAKANKVSKVWNDFKLSQFADDRFAVQGPDSAVIFEMNGSKIIVRGPKNAWSFPATPSMNPEGECLLIVDEKSLRFWQVSRKALEDLFFGD